MPSVSKLKGSSYGLGTMLAVLEMDRFGGGVAVCW